MNIALPAIIIFALLLPGFIVRSRFKRAERASLDYSPFGQVVTEAVLWACMLHLVWLFAAYLFFGQRFITEQLFRLLSADPAGQTRAIEWVGKRDVWIAIYFITILVFVYLAPAIARTAIIRWRLDRSQSPIGFLFRFKQAPWYYLLTGADFSEADKPDFISVAAILTRRALRPSTRGCLRTFFLMRAALWIAWS